MTKSEHSPYSSENIKIVFNKDQLDPVLENIEATASLVLIRDDTGKLMVINGKRGWDIPGGHIEDGETATGAAHREVLEEARVTVQNLKPYAAMINDNTAMAVYAADIKEMKDFTKNREDGITERAFMEINDFLSVYTGGDITLMKKLLSRL